MCGVDSSGLRGKRELNARSMQYAEAVLCNQLEGIPLLSIGKQAKLIRAKVIKGHLLKARYKRCVVFSCGNASREIKGQLFGTDIKVIDVSPTGELQPTKWFTPSEIIETFGASTFDATSGHLPLWLMQDIANELKKQIGHLDEPVYVVPTGSGETIIELQMAYPKKEFIAVYDLNPATEYSPHAPLNKIVEQNFIVYKQIK